MIPVSIPIPAEVQAEVAALLQTALDKLAPYQMTLTSTEQRSLYATTMGQGSVAFAQEAGQLLANYPQVLRRSITDAAIASYPLLLETYSAASNLEVRMATIASLLQSVALVAGARVMATVRPAYQDAQNDQGQTPSVHAIMERISARFAQGPAAVVPPVPVTA